jgi:hypothetical protein
MWQAQWNCPKKYPANYCMASNESNFTINCLNQATNPALCSTIKSVMGNLQYSINFNGLISFQGPLNRIWRLIIRQAILDYSADIIGDRFKLMRNLFIWLYCSLNGTSGHKLRLLSGRYRSVFRSS